MAQELWRRMCIEDAEGMPNHLNFWQSQTHEIDFVVPQHDYIEVKKIPESPMHFTWFLKTHPHEILRVINANTFSSEKIMGMMLESFLLG